MDKDYIEFSEDCGVCRWYELRYVASGGSGFWCGKKEVRVSSLGRIRRRCRSFEDWG